MVLLALTGKVICGMYLWWNRIVVRDYLQVSNVVEWKMVPNPLHEYEYNEYRWQSQSKRRHFSSHSFAVECCLAMHSRTYYYVLTMDSALPALCKAHFTLYRFKLRMKLFQHIVLPQLRIIYCLNVCWTTQWVSKFETFTRWTLNMFGAISLNL